MTREEIRQQFEAICVACWFLFDGFWLLKWHTLTYIGSFISIITAILIFFYLEKNLFQWLVAFVDTFWLLTNILWVISEFEELPNIEVVAKICFWIGTITLMAAYGVSPNAIVILRRLGFFKLSRKA